MIRQRVALDALAVALSAQTPVLLWGAPGTGKTSTVRALADRLGWPCETVVAAIREPSDFAGLPVVIGNSVRFAPPRWAERLAEAPRGILFLDEISAAPPAVQSALLRVVLERVVGDLTLPDDIVVVAAANPPEQVVGNWELSAPLANRFCHLDWEADAATVADGLAGGWPVPSVPLLPNGWDQGLGGARGRVAAFLRVRPGLVTDVPRTPSQASRGWPSPRSWEMAARLIAAAEASGAADDVVGALVTGAVGEGAALELLTWLTEMDLPDPEAVLADPAGAQLPDRGDRLYALLTAVASTVAARPTGPRWLAGWAVLARAGEAAPDVAAMAARALARCRPEGVSAPPEAALFAPLLRDAGLL